MEQYQYVHPWVHVRNSDGEWDVSHMFGRIAWSGDVDTVCRALELEMVVSATDPRLPYVYLPLGGGISMGVGEETLFIGVVASKDKSTDASTMSVSCYDFGFYLKNSKASRKYTGETPETITRQLCSTYGVPVGSLAQTGVAIRRKFSATELYRIIDTAYTLASQQTGKKYLLRFSGRQLNVIERTVTPQTRCFGKHRERRLRSVACGSHSEGCAFPKQRKRRLRGGRTRGEKPMVSPLLRITPFPSGRA